MPNNWQKMGLIPEGKRMWRKDFLRKRPGGRGGGGGSVYEAEKEEMIIPY